MKARATASRIGVASAFLWATCCGVGLATDCWKSGPEENCCVPNEIVCGPDPQHDPEYWLCEDRVSGVISVRTVQQAGEGQGGRISFVATTAGLCTREVATCGGAFGNCNFNPGQTSTCSHTDPQTSSAFCVGD